MEARPSTLTKKELCYFLTDRKEEDADTGKLSSDACHLLSPSPPSISIVLLRMLSMSLSKFNSIRVETAPI